MADVQRDDDAIFRWFYAVFITCRRGNRHNCLCPQLCYSILDGFRIVIIEAKERFISCTREIIDGAEACCLRLVGVFKGILESAAKGKGDGRVRDEEVTGVMRAGKNLSAGW